MTLRDWFENDIMPSGYIKIQSSESEEKKPTVYFEGEGLDAEIYILDQLATYSGTGDREIVFVDSYINKDGETGICIDIIESWRDKPIGSIDSVANSIAKFNEDGTSLCEFIGINEWKIEKGNKSLWWMLYYHNIPVLQCIKGKIEGNFRDSVLDFNSEKELIRKIKERCPGLK